MRDKWGGWPEINLPSTGFFRLWNSEGRWWFVTPDGSAFLSHGLNHVYDFLLYQPYNRSHWAAHFGLPETSPDEAFLAPFRKKVMADCVRLGCNTLGCHSPVGYYPESFIPYVYTLPMVNICHYMTPSEEDFHDVFSSAFARHCDQVAQEHVAPRSRDPFLIGYSLTDCPVWTEEDAAPRGKRVFGSPRPGLPTWPRVLRNLGPDSPGKQAYVNTVRELHGDDIHAFNDVYGTNFNSFNEVLRTVNWRPQKDLQNSAERRDNAAFLARIVDKAYETICAAIRRHDPNHLIVGDKLNGNSNVPDTLLRLAGKHFDLAFYQLYGLWDEHRRFIERLHRLTGKPVFCGDASVSVPNPHMPDPLGPHCASQEERAEVFEDLYRNAFARPEFVGWSWCGWLDSWQERQPEKQHSGIQDPFGVFYPIAEAMDDFSERMYEVARGIVG